MRTRHVFVLIAVAVVSGISLTAHGQDAPLPPITPKPLVMLVALPVEPEHATPTTTLADAARANDFPTFQALYEAAGRPAAYRALHDLWSYSMTDPLGAFYGPDMYAQFARAYDGYEAFIEDHQIVDSRGNVFYPTSETRAFLLSQAIRGGGSGPALRVPSTTTPDYTRSIPSTPSTPNVAPRKQRKRMLKAELVAPNPVPVQQPPLRAPEPVPAPAPVAVVQAIPAPPVPVRRAPAVAASMIPETPVEDASNVGRGLLLLIIGLVGVGLLATIVRAPRETMPSVTPRRDP